MSQSGDLIAQAVDRIDQPAPPFAPTPPPIGTFSLAAGYLDPATGVWIRDFTVRELTGRDEEALARITNTGTLIGELLNRGLVSVGNIPADPGLLDLLALGDWETVLLAIRAVTFGQRSDFDWRCLKCEASYDFTLDLEAVPTVRHDSPEDATFELTVGSHSYQVALPLGATQRKLLMMADRSVPEQNTVMLADCLSTVNGVPALGKETALGLPMRDRRELILMINQQRPGPRLNEVTTTCPACGATNNSPISVAALFRP